jgi:hypothetical protein
MSRLTAYIAAKWDDLSAWLCYQAWTYARKRAQSRAPWLPGEAKDAAEDDTLDQRRLKANEARQVLENRHFRSAWDALNVALEARGLSCDVYSDEGQRQAARILASKQLLHGLRREFERKLDDGYMAEVEIAEIERKRGRLRLQR